MCSDKRLYSTTKHPVVCFHHCQMDQIALVYKTVAIKQRGASLSQHAQPDTLPSIFRQPVTKVDRCSEGLKESNKCFVKSTHEHVECVCSLFSDICQNCKNRKSERRNYMYKPRCLAGEAARIRGILLNVTQSHK